MTLAISFVFAGALLLSGTSGRVPDTSFEYVFRRTECLKGYARDSNEESLFGDLRINSSAVTCKGLGVEAKPNFHVRDRVLSVSNSSRFVKEIDNGGGWTFEMWAIFQNFSDCPGCRNRHLASIGTINEDLIQGECSTTSNILLLQTDLGQSVAMQDSTVLADKTCNTMEARAVMDLGVPVHVIFTSATSGFRRTSSTSDDSIRTTCWYVNGVNTDCEVAPNKASQWQDGFYLQMLNDPVAVRSPNSSYAASAGSIFLVAMYNRSLSDREVMQNFNAGLENSPPVAEDIVITINEDGEIGDHYDDPALYVQDPMVPALNLSVVRLRVTDIDQQEGFPGFDEGDNLVLHEVYIASLPSRGTLYDFNGQPIEEVPHFVVTLDGEYPVRYRPRKDESSGSKDAYTSFTYTAVDAVSGEKSVVPGIVDIHVLPKNDPPVPRSTSTTISTGETLLFLGGTDVDTADGDAIVGFLVVEPPSHGVLHQVSLRIPVEVDHE